MDIRPLPRRHYAHAPITEAIIALGYDLPPEVSVGEILKLHDQLKPDYPARAERFTVEVQFQVDTAGSSGRAGEREINGYQFLHRDKHRIARVTRTDFTFSQLAPYDRWETLQLEATRVWSVVERTLRPRRINRLGVRFVNRIDIPIPGAGGVDLDRYFRAAPKVPPELPQTMSTFFVRLELPFEQPHGVLILTLAAAPPPTPGVVSAILDLDSVMQNVDLDSCSAWKTIEHLRDVKNAAFEASITDAARELFR